MVQNWKPNPQLKVTSGGIDITQDSVSARVTRPENAIDYAIITANNYKGINYIANLNLFDALEIFMDYSDASTKVFSGVIESVEPQLNLEGGQTLVASARGLGRALLLTHCNTNYGVESLNKDLETPSEIWTDIINNYVKKSFGGDSTGYDEIGISVGTGMTTPAINFLNGAYKPNFDLIAEICNIKTAAQAGSAGPHFFVDTDGTLRIKQIGTTLDTWTAWWRTDQAGSTLIEGDDILQHSFKKNTEGFANKIVYCSGLRKPGYDSWTEDAVANNLWGKDANIDLDDDPDVKMVGGNSLKITALDALGGNLWYPSGKTAAWDFTKVGSEKSIPSLNFYASAHTAISYFYVCLHTTDSRYFYWDYSGDITTTDEFFHFSFPIGPYYDRKEEKTTFKWNMAGSPNPVWSNINYVRFRLEAITDTYVWLDDLHFSGKIIREAYNPTNIVTNDEVQATIIDDTAYDDTLKASDDSGTVARIAYAELLRRQATPTIGTITLNGGAEDILPGQKVYVQCDKRNGTYRIDSAFRVTEIQHVFDADGFKTRLSLTSDLLNSFAKAEKSPASMLVEYTFMGHKEAKNLKVAGVDINVPRLSKPYSS